MRKQGFLDKLKVQGKLELVEPSDNVCKSYLEKAERCLQSAKILLDNRLYENSVSMSYYTMYNSLTAMLFKVGIKCENHSASMILLKNLFGNVGMFKIISFAKEERIDKQYYVDFVLTKGSAQDLFAKAEEFLLQMKLLINSLNTEDIKSIRSKYKTL